MPGRLYVVNSKSLQAPIEIYPTTHPAAKIDLSTSESGFGPPDPNVFFPHGINVISLRDGGYQLYVVNHGGREAVEMFHIILGTHSPEAVWTGCIPLPPRSFGNGIAPISGGGFVISNMYDPTDSSHLEKFAKGALTGHVLRWSTDRGWSQAVPQPFSGANGVEVSEDGEWLYVSEWSARKLWRLSLRGTSPATSVALDFLPDNLRWSNNGKLILAGQAAAAEQVFGCEARKIPCPMPFAVVEVDPETLRTRTLIRGGNEQFGGATGAATIGNEIWVGSFRSNKVARYQRIAIQ